MLTSTQLGFSLRYDAFANMAIYAVLSVCVVVRVCEREGGRQRESGWWLKITEEP